MTCQMFSQCVLENNSCLDNCNSTCLDIKGNESLITCRENNKTYYLHNNKDRIVAKYHVDGGVVRTNSTVRCDYLVIVYGDITKAIFVELKGKHIKHAYEQILESMNSLHRFIPNHNNAKFYARIIYNGRVPKDSLKSYTKNLKKLMFGLNCDKKVRIKECKKILDEDIEDLT